MKTKSAPKRTSVVAFNTATGEVIIPPPPTIPERYRNTFNHAKGRPYNKGIDEGHIVCAECRKAHLTVVTDHVKSGGREYVSSHFSKLTDHAASCTSGNNLPPETNKRNIDNTKAPFAYLNTSAQNHKKRAWFPKEISDSDLPSGIMRVETKKDENGWESIASPSFSDRPRWAGIKNVSGFIKMLKELPDDHLKNAFIVINPPKRKEPNNNIGMAIPLKSMLIREMVSDQENQKFKKYIQLLETQEMGIQHPVLIHFEITENLQKQHSKSEEKISIKLGAFHVPNPNAHGTDLPERTINRIIQVKDKNAFASLEKGKEYFAIAHPYLASDNGTEWISYQYFNILSANDIIQKSMADYIKERHKAQNKNILSNQQQTRAAQPA